MTLLTEIVQTVECNSRPAMEAVSHNKEFKAYPWKEQFVLLQSAFKV
jgi:hypothetical protein